MMNTKFEVIDYAPEKWGELFNASDERTIFQSPAWLTFLQKTQNGEPIVAVLKDGSQILGYFSGMVIKKFGLRILGSPFPGWMTDYMGFNLSPGVPRRLALMALPDLAFNQLKCLHLECLDRFVTSEEAKSLGFQVKPYTSFEVDLSKGEEKLFGEMSSACRRCIRKSEREGVVIEQAQDIEFAEEYYFQLKQVFAKRKLVPTYDIFRVRELIRHLLPSGQLLLLRARNMLGDCIATGIFPALNHKMHFWGGASLTEHQHVRPNEALHWFAMRYWKNHGIQFYDMGGGGEYKKKYGGRQISTPWISLSKYPWLSQLRDLAKKTIRYRQQILGGRQCMTLKPDSINLKYHNRIAIRENL